MMNFIRSLFNNIVEARMQKAQHQIAYLLWSTEYKHESFDYVLNAVRTGKIHELGVSK